MSVDFSTQSSVLASEKGFPRYMNISPKGNVMVASCPSNIIFGVALVVLVGVSGCSRTESRDEPSVRSVVIGFGHELKQVSLTAEPEIAAQAIREHYAAWVTTSLLDSWIRNPATAPGRAVSSPWPDRIEIDSLVAVSKTEYQVKGRVMEMTSVELSQHQPGTPHPVEISVENRDGRWLIARYSQNKETVETAPVPDTADDVNRGRIEAPDAVSAAALLDAYYEAINRKDYPRAYALWASNGEASGKTLDQFAAGFARTDSVGVTVGEPGPIGAAAGSRYIEIPVTIDARLSNGKEQHFTGTYTLRRSVVDGATAEQRAWRIYKAHITEKSS
jgi:hypothetical protein